MKHLKFAAFTIAALLGGMGIASAMPSMSPEVAGSAIIFNVQNPDERGYRCVITYAYSWDDFGTRTTHHDQSSSFVPAHFNGQLLKVTQNSPNVALDSSSMSCM